MAWTRLAKGCNVITVEDMDTSRENVHIEAMVVRLASKERKEAREAKEAKDGYPPRKEDGHGTRGAKVARMAKALVEDQKGKAKAQARVGGTISLLGSDTKVFAGSAGR